MVLVFFLGGCSFAEISALRYLASREEGEVCMCVCVCVHLILNGILSRLPSTLKYSGY